MVKVLIFSSEGPAWDFKLFGDLLADCALAKTAALLLDNATKSSSRNTCKSGYNRFHQFALKYMGAYFTPQNHHHLSLKGLVLSFFTASLFLHNKNSKIIHNSKLCFSCKNYVGENRSQFNYFR